MTLYLTLEEVLHLHAEIMGVAVEFARDNVRDENLLESALARPRQAANYAGADLAEQAATLLWGSVRNHAFVDGNKRTAYVVAQTFLRGNGKSIAASEDEKFDLVVAAAHELDVIAVGDWIRRHLVRHRE